MERDARNGMRTEQRAQNNARSGQQNQPAPTATAALARPSYAYRYRAANAALLSNYRSERGVASPAASWRRRPRRVPAAERVAPNSGRIRARARLANTRKPKPSASYQ